MIAGIDEAGRGPAFGPLVVAGVLGSDQETFRVLGVRDSKLLPPKRRRELDTEVRRAARRVEVVTVSGEDIDRRRAEETLNEIEVDAFAEVARRLGGSELFLDAADVDAPRFGRLVEERIGPACTYGRFVSEHRADVNHPVVSAASIVAKVRRDAEVARLAAPLEAELGLPLGSGYVTDGTSMRFLEAYRRTFGAFPEGTRRSWDPVRALEAKVVTRRLEEFPAPAPPSARRPRRGTG